MHDYVKTVDEFVWLPGAAEAVARLAGAGYAITVVSNQRGVARGLVAESVLRELERVIQRELASSGCQVEAFRYCLHENHEDCQCRKPRPGMLLSLAADLHLDLSRSWMIGDSEADVLAGEAAGCRTGFVGSEPQSVTPDLVARSLAAASRQILAFSEPARSPRARRSVQRTHRRVRDT